MKRASFITWPQLKVGAIILVAIAVMTVAIYKLGRAANLFASRYDLVTYFPNANGLREGGAVALNGQQVGVVKRIDFLKVDDDTTRNLRVTIEIDENIREQIREDSKARVRTMGLLGDKMVDITSGTPQFAVLQPGDTLPGTQALDYEQVLAQAAGAVDDMVILTADLREITGGIVRGEGTVGQLMTNRTLYDEMTGTMAKMNALLTRMQNPQGSIGRMLDDPQLYERLTGMMSALDTLLTQVHSREGSIGMLLRDTTLAVNLVGVVDKADSLMSLMTNGDGFASRMLTDDQLYDNLNKAITDLNAMLEDMRKDPRKYFRGMVKVF